METAPWRLRALQLDLARQKETLDYIRQVVEFAGKHHFNTLHLYLEGCVRTPSFPYPQPDVGYSSDEMTEIVTYAARYGLESIPQVNCFNHADVFLSRDPLRRLSELREGIAGRFGFRNPGTFCPSLEETYAFLERYLSEISAIFPSRFMHVGCDEVWTLGFCSRCRERLARGETHADIYAAHLLRLHEIVVGKLGKRMMIWDDMFEEYPEALTRLPTDIVLCVWQYDDVVSRTKTHCGRRRSDHRLAEYRRRHFDYLICPTTRNLSNAESFTRYAAPFQPLGGLLTVWELRQSFLLANYPLVAHTGRLWNEPSTDRDEIFHGVCVSLFGVEDPVFIDAVKTFQFRTSWQSSVLQPQAALRGPLTAYEVERSNTTNLLLLTLGQWLDRVRGKLAKAVMEDILITLQGENVQHTLRMLALKWRENGTNPDVSTIETLRGQGERILTEIRELKHKRTKQWRHWRKAIPFYNAEPPFTTLEHNVEEWLRGLTDATKCPMGFLAVHYVLPDYYGRQDVCWRVQYEGDPSWHEISRDVPKPWQNDWGQQPFYTVEIPFASEYPPRRLALESWGLGGIGVRFVEAAWNGESMVPSDVTEVRGKAQNPRSLLSDDTYWCTIGEENTQKAMLDPRLTEEIHGLRIELTPRKET